MGPFTIEFYEDPAGSRPIEDWIDHDLTDVKAAALLAALEHVLSHSGIGVCGTEWGKQLGDGLFEFRVRHTAAEIRRMFSDGASEHRDSGKVLLRVFCHAYGAKIVLLLNGYDKGTDPSEKRQRNEIALARRRLTEFKQRQARDRAARRRGKRG